MKKDISIDKELFTPLTAEEKKVNSVVRPSVGYWKDAWSRLKSNKMALTSLIIIIVIMFSAFILPLFLPYTYDGTNLEIANQSPSKSHWFGTDQLGRDILVRVLYGAKYSLIIGIAVAIINLFIGVLYGGIAGFLGGRRPLLSSHPLTTL